MPTVHVINEANPFPFVYTNNSLSLQSLNTVSLILSKQDNTSVIITRVLVFVVRRNPKSRKCKRRTITKKNVINTRPVQLTAVVSLPFYCSLITSVTWFPAFHFSFHNNFYSLKDAFVSYSSQ
jgi:hypothetical protein